MSGALIMIRGPVVFGASWGLMELLRKVLHLGTGWPLWTIALITALAVEFISTRSTRELTSLRALGPPAEPTRGGEP